MADTRELGERAQAFEKQAALAKTDKERDRLYAEAAKERAALDAENASNALTVRKPDGSYYDTEGKRIP